jgi:hypothetical protein
VSIECTTQKQEDSYQIQQRRTCDRKALVRADTTTFASTMTLNHGGGKMVAGMITNSLIVNFLKKPV